MTLTRVRRCSGLFAAAATGLLVIQSCGGRAASADRDYALDAVRSKADAAARLQVFDTLDDVLPNVVYRSGGKSSSMTTAVVVGRLVSARHGRAFVNDVPQSQEVGYSDAAADWRTVHFEVEVDRTLSGQQIKTLTVGVSIGAGTDPDRFARGLMALGRVVLLITPQDSVFDYDDSVHPLLGGGELVATVSSEGHLALPAMDEAEADGLLKNTRTEDELATVSGRSTRQVEVSTTPR